MKDLTYIPDCRGNMGQWKERHLYAVRQPWAEKEQPFLQMLQGWLDYAKNHEARFNSKIGDDYVLGDAWFNIGVALNTMLNGDLGTRLDCGTLNTIINDNLTEQGWDVDLGEKVNRT
jgi:hypothetical protein